MGMETLNRVCLVSKNDFYLLGKLPIKIFTLIAERFSILGSDDIYRELALNVCLSLGNAQFGHPSTSKLGNHFYSDN